MMYYKWQDKIHLLMPKVIDEYGKDTPVDAQH